MIVALLFGAYRLRAWHPSTVDEDAPKPWLVGAIALLGTSAYRGPAVLVTAEWYEWVGSSCGASWSWRVWCW